MEQLTALFAVTTGVESEQFYVLELDINFMKMYEAVNKSVM